MSRPFTLYEALLWDPPAGYFLLDGHLRRLQHSASFFEFTFDLELTREKLLQYARGLPLESRKVRLELAAGGMVTLMDAMVNPNKLLRAKLSQNPVESGDVFLRHKTSRREVFEAALAANPEAQEVILCNERQELTETCHGNLVLELDNRRLTPPLSSGLLPGVFRAHLLERGVVQEQILPVTSLQHATKLFMINSVRGWCELQLSL